MNDWTDEYFEAHLALLKTLAAIPAPSHHEDERAAFIKDWLDFYVISAMRRVLFGIYIF